MEGSGVRLPFWQWVWKSLPLCLYHGQRSKSKQVHLPYTPKFSLRQGGEDCDHNFNPTPPVRGWHSDLHQCGDCVCFSTGSQLRPQWARCNYHLTDPRNLVGLIVSILIPCSLVAYKNMVSSHGRQREVTCFPRAVRETPSRRQCKENQYRAGCFPTCLECAISFDSPSTITALLLSFTPLLLFPTGEKKVVYGNQPPRQPPWGLPPAIHTHVSSPPTMHRDGLCDQ